VATRLFPPTVFLFHALLCLVLISEQTPHTEFALGHSELDYAEVASLQFSALLELI